MWHRYIEIHHEERIPPIGLGYFVCDLLVAVTLDLTVMGRVET